MRDVLRRVGTPLVPAALAAAMPFAAIAEELKSYPRIEGALLVEIQNDYTFQSDDPANELNDLYNTTELGLSVLFNPYVSIETALTFEPVLDPTGDRAFEDHGLYAEELYFQIRPAEFLRLYGGKFNPAFGTAWDVTPGVYGVDFAEDYEVTERLGFGFEATAKATPLGSIALSSSVYQVDTSKLSESLFTNRGRTTLADGGAGNTGELDSFNVALDIFDIPGLDGVGAHAAYRYHPRGQTGADISAETGFVLGLNGEHELGGENSFTWVAEYAQIDDVDGQTTDRLRYYTLGGALVSGIYNVSASVTARPRDVTGGPDLDDILATVSAGVEVYDGWTLDAGYKYHVEDNVDNHTVGLLLAKEIEFAR